MSMWYGFSVAYCCTLHVHIDRNSRALLYDVPPRGQRSPASRPRPPAMSLAFLSKKTWHVTNFANQEAVWKAEQKDAEENRKMEEWKTKREEERQVEELRRLQRESGQGGSSGKPHQERVDFLYEQQTTKKDEYLRGKAVEEQPEQSDVKQVESLPGANFLGVGQNNLSSSANEEFNKMSNDPLVAMRQEEQKALQRILANPLKMKAIRGAADEKRSTLESERREHKHGKKHKKEHKRKGEKKDKHKHKSSRRRGHDSDSSSEGEGESRRAAADANERRDEGRDVDGPPKAGGMRLYGSGGLQMYTGGEKRSDGGRTAGGASTSGPEFEACEQFDGPRAGYTFKQGEQGLGYYRDAKAAETSGRPLASDKPLAPSHPAPAPEPKAAPGRYGGSGGRQGGGGRPGRAAPLSAAEKEERVRQMMSDAREGDQRKRARLEKAD